MNKTLAAQLLSMSEKDQNMRTVALENDDLWDYELDKKNTAQLKVIIKKHGWPTISLVGAEAANAAWLLVQHADHDPEFQAQCLAMMLEQPNTHVSKQNIAYLEDRVRVAQGRPQLYGTQFDSSKHFGPKKIDDRKNLNKRRKGMGLSTFEEYKLIMDQYYKKEA